MLKKKRFAWLALLLAFGLVAAACGDDDDTSSDDTTDDGESGTDGGDCPADVEGDVVVSGSSTVEPISTTVGEKLLDCSSIAATVDGPGTGDGFELFCAGDTDISDASRPIDEEEVAACEDAGIEFIELKVAFDGISVLTNPANDEVECLNFADMYAIFGPESEGVDNWSKAQPSPRSSAAPRSSPMPPAASPAPGAESGTYDSFNEIVFGDISEAQLEAGAIAEDQVETSRQDYAVAVRRHGDHRRHGGRGHAAGVRRLRLRRGGRRRGEGDRGHPRGGHRLRRAVGGDDRRRLTRSVGGSTST